MANVNMDKKNVKPNCFGPLSRALWTDLIFPSNDLQGFRRHAERSKLFQSLVQAETLFVVTLLLENLLCFFAGPCWQILEFLFEVTSLEFVFEVTDRSHIFHQSTADFWHHCRRPRASNGHF